MNMKRALNIGMGALTAHRLGMRACLIVDSAGRPVYEKSGAPNRTACFQYSRYAAMAFAHIIIKERGGTQI